MNRRNSIRLAGIAAFLFLALLAWLRMPASVPAPAPPGPTLAAAARAAAPAVQAARATLPPTPPRAAVNGPVIRLRAGNLAPAAAAASEPPVHARPSARGYPWLVLFDGPIRPEWRAALEASGTTLRAYLPDNTLLVEAPAEALGRISKLPHVHWSGEYRPALKLQPLLASLARREPDLPVPVTIQTFAPEDVGALADQLAAAGGSGIQAAAGRRWGLVRGVLPARTAVEFAGRPEVQWVEHYEPPRPLNDFALASDRLNIQAARESHGLDGAGQVVAIADTGLDTGNLATLHPDLAGRVIQVFDIGRLTNWSDTYYHGTHVAGSLLGSGAASGGQYRGAAPAAQLVFQSTMTAGNTLNLPDDLNDLYRPPYDAGARIHSDSWGSAVAGEYTADAMTTDEFIWDQPGMFVAFAAGNEGTDANRDGVVDAVSLDSPASAKNVLAVGGAESGRPSGSGGLTARTYGSAWPSDFRAPPVSTDLISSSPDGAPQGLAAFSSRGPAADGRTKPDIVAPGTDIVSVRSRASTDTGWGVLGANTNYCFMGGTSMATPLAAGAATLVRQYCTDRRGLAAPSAALIKAALAGGARSLTPGQHGTDVFREIPPPPRPNPAEGWGQIDITGTLFPSNGLQAALVDDAPALETGGTNSFAFLVTSNAPLAVALAYSDYPSALAAAANLVNDLDLRLVNPAGLSCYPNGRTDPDPLNNLEGIDVAAPATGRWTLVVSGRNVPQGPQPYALYLRGALQMPLAIEHEPLADTLVTNAPYHVAAEVSSAGTFDTNTVRLVWIATGSTGGFTTVAMATTNGSRYEADIPARPVGARIWYYIAAGPAGLTAYHPAGAPILQHTFAVVPPVTLAVTGFPANVLAADPAYGTQAYPSNHTLRARALYDPAGTNGWRTACIGWRGTGSVPPTGAIDFVDLTLAADSSIAWQWQDQAGLMHTSSPYGALADTTWHPVGSTATSLIAPETHRFNNVLLGFAGWLVDGARFPPAPAPSRTQVGGIGMTAPRTATATYLPLTQDSDANGLPDWFEQRFFGAAGQDRYGDPDGDDYENELEAADHTDPFNAASVPVPPDIQHAPLASPAATPAPWTVTATITDNYRVASAALHWQRNGGLLRSAAMTNLPGSTTLFSAQIPSPARDGDTLAYHLTAVDEAGFAAQSATWTVTVAYARITVAPEALTASAPAHTLTNRDLFIWNTGSRPLEVSFEIGSVGFADDVESGTNGWTRPDGNTDWHISALNAHSPANAWYCGQPLSQTYRNSTHAALVTPPIQLGTAPRLDFVHRARFEPDTDLFPGGAHYWDSGVLEVSDNNGLTWQALVPEGGYPGLITSNAASPFAPDTPCFADTLDWDPVGADLSAYAGREIRLRFRFGADMYVTAEGWRLDDIVVSPRTEYAGWLALPATNASVAAGLGLILPVGLDTTPLPPMAAGHCVLRIHHNDPERPSPIVVPVSLCNTTRRVRVDTEGSGQAAPAGETLVPAGAPFALDLTADPGNFIADIQTNQMLVPLPDVVTTQHLAWTALAGNLDIHAVFAPVLADGLVPPAWLAQYSLTSRNWMAEASLDQDRDGLLTWQEHELDSDPTNSADAPLIVSFVPNPHGSNAWRVTWHAFTNPAATYDIVSSTNLVEGFVFVTNLPAAPPVMTSPPLPPDRRFFGLRMH